MSEPSPSPPLCRIENSFVRGRNVLVSEGSPRPLFSAWERHCRRFKAHPPAEPAELFRNFLAAFVLHAASHPRNEVLAWTIHLRDPHCSLFLAADTEMSTVTGRVHTDHLKKEETNLFYQDLVVRGKPPHRSIVPFEGNSAKGAVEFFYNQSEQRPGRLFFVANNHYILASAHPDYDRRWFRNLSPGQASALREKEVVAPIESRGFRWHCGCSHPKILEILTSPMRSDAEALFGGEETIQVNCPRCAAKYTVTREAMEARIAEKEA